MTQTCKPSVWPRTMNLMFEALEQGIEPKSDTISERLESIENKIDKLFQPAYRFDGERYVKSNGLYIPLILKDE